MTAAQHLDALERANAVRLTNAALRREIAAMDRQAALERLAEIVENTTCEVTLRAKAGYLTQAPHRMGEGLTHRLFRRLRINPERRLGELSRRERELLAGALRQIATGRGWGGLTFTSMAGFVSVTR